jgi:predicted dehydrogenase
MEECQELVTLAEARDRTLMIGQMQRFKPAYQAVKENLEDGVLGEIHHARIDAIQNLPGMYPPPHWLYENDKAGGGSIISVLVHKIDLLRYFLGDVQRAIALGKNAHDSFQDVEDYCTGLLEFENGTMVDLFNTYSAAGVPYDELFWLFGDDGVIHALPEDMDDESYIGMPDPQIRLRDDEGSRKDFAHIDPSPEEVGLQEEDGFVNELLHFGECVETGQEPLTSGQDNLGTMATIFAIYESMDNNGEPVRINDILNESK